MERADSMAGLVLAGGRASRMGGREKTLLELHGKPMLQHVVERLRPQLGPIAISANGDPARFAALGLPVLPDDEQFHLAGPLAGILAGLRWARGLGSAEWLLTAAGDTPYPPPDLAARLSAALSARPDGIAVAASGGRRHPVFALWPIGIADDLEGFLADGSNASVAAFIDRHDAVSVDFPFAATPAGPLDPFFNVNAPEDYEAALSAGRRTG